MVDSANGSASELAAEVFGQLGAEVVAIGDDPDGTNINAGCGSTDTGLLARAVVEHGAALGLALDGDADRLLAVDETGALVDGDSLLALFARDLAGRGQLAGNTVVVTVMTNLGFRRAMEARGILVKETDVGDRHVLAAIDKEGLSLGGEQSGHIIFRRLSTTGDGLLTGLVLADLLARTGSTLSGLLDGFLEAVPQTLVNVRGADTSLYPDVAAIEMAVAQEREALGATGRVLVRPSGTEPVVRVMVESTEPGAAEATAQRLHALIEHELLEAARARERGGCGRRGRGARRGPGLGRLSRFPPHRSTRRVVTHQVEDAGVTGSARDLRACRRPRHPSAPHPGRPTTGWPRSGPKHDRRRTVQRWARTTGPPGPRPPSAGRPGSSSTRRADRVPSASGWPTRGPT